MHLAVSPVLLGRGEHLLGGLDLPALGYERTEYVSTPGAAHYVVAKNAELDRHRSSERVLGVSGAAYTATAVTTEPARCP